MNELILHHYPMSPFAEKIRAIFGAKQITWKSVDIPRIMPKPDVVALTGGYRKTPILQIGADIICDTALIARKIDELVPEPQLYPDHVAVNAEVIAAWADSVLFNSAVPLAFQPQVMAETFAGREQELQAFAADRAAMRKGATMPRTSLENAKNILHRFVKNFECQLQNGQAFVCGGFPCIADFSIYHSLWFLWTKPIVCDELTPYPAIMGWLQLMKEFGHGSQSELSSTEAIAIAKGAKTKVEPGHSVVEKFAVGDEITVQPTDYGIDPVQGKLLLCDEIETVILRNDNRVGDVAVHFPRANYAIEKVEQ